LTSYTRSGSLSGLKILCEGEPYLAVAGKFYLVSPETFSHFPTEAKDLDESTCSTLDILETPGSRFIRDSALTYYLVENGKKRPIASKAQYLTLKGDSAKYISVDSYFTSKIPTGKKMPLSSSAIGDDESTATPTPTPTPTPSPSPTTSGKTYIVKAGDTLIGIAVKFKTTSAILAKLNNITDISKIRVGQVLKLP
jgi:LysM repeat protein